MQSQQTAAGHPTRVERCDGATVFTGLQLARTITKFDELGVPTIGIVPIIAMLIRHRAIVSGRALSAVRRPKYISVPIAHPTPPGRCPIVGYTDWLKDFERRLALHDEGVAALARDLAARTSWDVHAKAPGFTPAAPRAGRPPDVQCDRGVESPPVLFEVELPETLVRRETVRRLSTLVDGELEMRVVMIADDDDHTETIREAGRLLRCVGLEIHVAAISPHSDTLTGADW